MRLGVGSTSEATNTIDELKKNNNKVVHCYSKIRFDDTETLYSYDVSTKWSGAYTTFNR